MPYCYSSLFFVMTILAIALALLFAAEWVHMLVCTHLPYAQYILKPLCGAVMLPPLSTLVATVGGGVQGLATSLRELPAPTMLLESRLQLHNLANLVLHAKAIKDPYMAKDMHDIIIEAANTTLRVTSGVNILFFSTRAMVGQIDTYTNTLLRKLKWDPAQIATIHERGGPTAVAISNADFDRYREHCLEQIRKVIYEADVVLLQFSSLDRQLIDIGARATKATAEIEGGGSGLEKLRNYAGLGGQYSRALQAMSWLNATAHNGLKQVGILKDHLEGFQTNVLDLNSHVESSGEGAPFPWEHQHAAITGGLAALTDSNKSLRKPYFEELGSAEPAPAPGGRA
jgi:hypothetical protein